MKQLALFRGTAKWPVVWTNLAFVHHHQLFVPTRFCATYIYAHTHTHTHTHTFKSHFPGECSLASCPLIFIIQCLASGYASQHILSRSLSLEIETVAAGRASRVKISWGASLGLLSLSSAAGLLVAIQSEACERGPVINKRPHQSQT